MTIGLEEVLKRYQSRYWAASFGPLHASGKLSPSIRLLSHPGPRAISAFRKKKADFVTAPRSFPDFWRDHPRFISMRAGRKQTQAARRPSPWTLLELGPGRGTLLKDVLRVLKNFPSCFAALRLEGLETNRYFQKHTEQELQELRFSAPPIHWNPNIQSMGPRTEFYFILANEFFDCLPVRQFSTNSTPTTSPPCGRNAMSNLNQPPCLEPQMNKRLYSEANLPGANLPGANLPGRTFMAAGGR